MADIVTGLKCWFKMDEGEGTILHDASLNGNTGIMTSATPPFWTASGPRSMPWSINYDGTGYTEITQTSGFPAYNLVNLTIAMWVNGAAQNDHACYSDASTASNNPMYQIRQPLDNQSKVYVLVRDDANTTRLDRLNGGAGGTKVTSTATVFDSTWHHICWTDANGTAKMYVDGIADAGTWNYTRGTSTFNTSTLAIVRRAALNAAYIGLMDDFRVYNRALAAADVTELFNYTYPHKSFSGISTRPRAFAPGLAR